MKQFLTGLFSVVLSFCAFSQTNISQHVEFFSLEWMQRRSTGSEGLKRAVEYCSNYFKQNQLTPLSSNYLYESLSSHKEVVSAHFSTRDETGKVDYEFLKDFMVINSEGVDSVYNKILFVGYGISDEHFESYKNIKELSGQVVMFLDKVPQQIINGLQNKNVSVAYRALTAKMMGADAVIVVTTDQPLYNDQYFNNLGSTIGTIPIIKITESCATSIFEKEAYVWPVLMTMLKVNPSMNPIDVQKVAKIQIGVKDFAISSTHSAFGMIKSAVPSREYVLVVANLDQDGQQIDKKNVPLAPDDRYAAAMVLELSNYLKDKKLNRNVVLIFNGGHMVSDKALQEVKTLLKDQHCTAVIDVDALGYTPMIAVEKSITSSDSFNNLLTKWKESYQNTSAILTMVDCPWSTNRIFKTDNGVKLSSLNYSEFKMKKKEHIELLNNLSSQLFDLVLSIANDAN